MTPYLLSKLQEAHDNAQSGFTCDCELIRTSVMCDSSKHV